MSYMITDRDVEKLKQTFVTKEEFRSEIWAIFQKFSDQMVELITVSINESIRSSTESLSRLILKNQADTDETLDSHEQRLDKLEDKVYS